jgi:L-2-hydroxyglutarate oxidase LhgO
MSERLDCVVIGAGVVGLAVARQLAQQGRQVVVLEAESSVAMHTSSRNSEVIHAGIYYPEGSLKARLCVEGRQQLYDYCAQRRVPHRRIGKLILACDETETGYLQNYVTRASANGVTDLQFLSSAEVFDLEPAVRCVGALLSPSTGIIDSHAFVMALRADLEAAGGIIVFRSRIVQVNVAADTFELRLQDADETVSCSTLVNAAGLWAPELAAKMQGFPAERAPRSHLAKGHYFTLRGPSPFARLVYPVAGGGGLGVHVTLDMNGVARFGPDVAWIDTVDYSFDESRKPAFAEAIRRYYPGLQADRLTPGYTGIRPKISSPTEPAADFLVQGPDAHGIPGLVNLFGIESPGLTSALPLAVMVEVALRDTAINRQSLPPRRSNRSRLRQN